MVVVTKYGVTLSFIDLLQIILVTLKLQGHIFEAWWVVLLPYILIGGYHVLVFYLESLLNYQEIKKSRK